MAPTQTLIAIFSTMHAHSHSITRQHHKKNKIMLQYVSRNRILIFNHISSPKQHNECHCFCQGSLCWDRSPDSSNNCRYCGSLAIILKIKHVYPDLIIVAWSWVIFQTKLSMASGSMSTTHPLFIHLTLKLRWKNCIAVLDHGVLLGVQNQIWSANIVDDRTGDNRLLGHSACCRAGVGFAPAETSFKAERREKTCWAGNEPNIQILARNNMGQFAHSGQRNWGCLADTSNNWI